MWKKCVILYELRIFGEDDFYSFDSCEECMEHFESDIYTIEDVYDYMKLKKGEDYVK